MSEEYCLIDTDILSYILKRKEPIYQKSCDYLRIHKKFTISCITYYECVRGYKAVNAFKRLEVFQEFLKITDILYLDNPILNKAGEIYGLLKNKGELTGEFDILIGATALVNNLAFVTNNARHYNPLKKYFSLKLANWSYISNS
ncbi:MAG: hypothetical protein BWK80_03160 [Desulfobacteraceae bacterium IS3]|nr:MAG: hypothetical protein BWK80_03160 [Desulfobacteraceae bacterium IS3]